MTTQNVPNESNSAQAAQQPNEQLSSQENPEGVEVNLRIAYRGCFSNMLTGRLYDLDITEPAPNGKRMFIMSYGRADDEYRVIKDSFDEAMEALSKKMAPKPIKEVKEAPK